MFDSKSWPKRADPQLFFKWYLERRETNSAAAIDTETTGLTATDEVVEIGAADDNGGISRFTLPVAATISPKAAEVNGITPDKLEREGMPFADGWAEIDAHSAATRRGWIAWNGAFDARMLNQSVKANQLDLSKQIVLDVCEPVSVWTGMPRRENGRLSMSLDAACVLTGTDLEARLTHHAADLDAQLILNALDVMARDPQRFEKIVADPARLVAQLDGTRYQQQLIAVADWGERCGWELDPNAIEASTRQRGFDLWNDPLTQSVMKLLQTRAFKDETANRWGFHAPAAETREALQSIEPMERAANQR